MARKRNGERKPGPDRRRLLLLSSGRDPAGTYLHYAGDAIRDILGAGVRDVTFLPFAAVTGAPEDYASRVRAVFAEWGYGLSAVPADASAATSVRRAEALVVGGGNTFHLLDRLRAHSLIGAIRQRVRRGIPYIGWSAGAVVACPSIGTTNDMPIVAPSTLEALALVPFHVNAHYTDFHPPGFHGETRAERIAEFLAVHPDARVLGLREGSYVRVDHGHAMLGGKGGARLFAHARDAIDLASGAALDGLLPC